MLKNLKIQVVCLIQMIMKIFIKKKKKMKKQNKKQKKKKKKTQKKKKKKTQKLQNCKKNNKMNKKNKNKKYFKNKLKMSYVVIWKKEMEMVTSCDLILKIQVNKNNIKQINILYL